MPFTEPGQIEWLYSTENPALERGDLHLWRVDLKLLGEPSEWEWILSPDERARAQRLLSFEKRNVFITARSALRLILANYIHRKPNAIQLGYTEMGKPYLLNPNNLMDIRFNVSHSGRWMILGVYNGVNVGVDIEEIRPVQKNWALKHLFSDPECEYLASLTEYEKDAEFIAAWTEKEAAAKVNGSGLSRNAANQAENMIDTRGQAQNGLAFFRKGDCWFTQFTAAPGYLGCAAVQTGQQPRVVCFEFSPRENSGISPQ